MRGNSRTYPGRRDSADSPDNALSQTGVWVQEMSKESHGTRKRGDARELYRTPGQGHSRFSALPSESHPTGYRQDFERIVWLIRVDGSGSRISKPDTFIGRAASCPTPKEAQERTRHSCR